LLARANEIIERRFATAIFSAWSAPHEARRCEMQRPEICVTRLLQGYTIMGGGGSYRERQ
jgi:hypothetical protein